MDSPALLALDRYRSLGIRELKCTRSGYRAIFIAKQDLVEIHYIPELRSFIEPYENVIQIVGDCSAFSDPGAARAETELRKVLWQHPACAILWGYTGCPAPGRDINQILNDWIDEDPVERSARCFANIVDEGTTKALRDWGCRFPINPTPYRNFIALVGGADFGDDTVLSDRITDHLVVFEGGIQSFVQLVNCLERNCTVTLVCGLRTEARQSEFSAAGFLRELFKSETTIEDYLGSCTNNFTANQLQSIETTWRRLKPILPNIKNMTINSVA